jgi:hypothetical protein
MRLSRNEIRKLKSDMTFGGYHPGELASNLRTVRKNLNEHNENTHSIYKGYKLSEPKGLPETEDKIYAKKTKFWWWKK